MNTLKLDSFAKPQNDKNVGEYVTDRDRFAMFSQLARLLAAEDIIVRWNVRGMDSPAAMNYATRVLDVAPIKREREHMIPGLILHEVGHFIFSENVATESNTGHSIDVARARELREKIKNHHVWNIIEDGYVERCLVVKWPGSLKHLRALYDFHLELAKSSGHMGSADDPGQLVIDVINTLHLNLDGVKWNDRYEYPQALPNSLLKLLERARTIVGTADERAELSSQIVDALNELASHKQLRATPSRKASTRGVRIVEIDPSAGSGERSAEATGSSRGSVNPATLDPELEAQCDVDRALSADLELAEAPAAPEESSSTTPTPAETDAVTTTDDEPAADEPDEPAADEPDEPAADGDDDGDDAGDYQPADDGDDTSTVNFEQFISDNKARIIGANKHLLQSMLVQTEANPNSACLVPTIEQVVDSSRVEDIISDELRLQLPNVSFHRFQDKLRASPRDTTNRLPSAFNKKLATARAIAQQLFQRFSTKANAVNIALTRYRTTGALDPTRATLYRIYDDVFQKRRQTPQQINHGYVVMVDWSSSMDDSSIELFHRIAELALFAQLAKVEIDIWLYTTDGLLQSEDGAMLRVAPQQGLMLLGSKFIHVLNTKQHVGDMLSYRLYAMFLNAVRCKLNVPGQMAFETELLFNGLNFQYQTYVSQSGTNIFEALNFAVHRARLLTTQRRAIMLLTDGEDSKCFTTVIDDAGKSYSGTRQIVSLNRAPQNRQVVYNGVNLIDIAAEALSQARARGSETTPLDNVRTLATAMLADAASSEGIAIIGVTWGYFVNAALDAWTRKNVVRIQVSFAERRSRSLHLYSKVDNTFITHITEALLSNIKK